MSEIDMETRDAVTILAIPRAIALAYRNSPVHRPTRVSTHRLKLAERDPQIIWTRK